MPSPSPYAAARRRKILHRLQGANETADGIVVSQPRTVLAVDVSVEKDVTLSGPYARYAQKFLGVRAPLTDKTGWAVTGAAVALLDAKACLDAPAPAEPSRRIMTHAAAEDDSPACRPTRTT